MMRYDGGWYRRGGMQTVVGRRERLDVSRGYRFSLLAPPPAGAEWARPRWAEPYSVRAVTPSLRPLMLRHNGRCPECAGPLVSGEACVACPVCGFRRQG